MKNKGFTFIEFMFVVAIISVLSSIIFVSLNTARAKAQDAKIKAQLAGLRNAAQIYYNENGNYGAASNFCSSSFFVDVGSSMNEHTTQANYPAGATLTCRSSETAYAVSALLPGAGGTNSWCVDSLGSSKMIETPTANTYCVPVPPYGYEYQYQTPYVYQYQYQSPYAYQYQYPSPYTYQYQYQTPYVYPYPTPCVPEPGSCNAQEGGPQNACGIYYGVDSCGNSCSRTFNNCNPGQSCENWTCVSN